MRIKNKEKGSVFSWRNPNDNELAKSRFYEVWNLDMDDEKW
jgi:hypothetical protein